MSILKTIGDDAFHGIVNVLQIAHQTNDHVLQETAKCALLEYFIPEPIKGEKCEVSAENCDFATEAKLAKGIKGVGEVFGEHLQIGVSELKPMYSEGSMRTVTAQLLDHIAARDAKIEELLEKIGRLRTDIELHKRGFHGGN